MTSNKYLLYCSSFCTQDYVESFNLFLKSIHLFSKINTIDFLVFTSSEFESQIRKISEDLRIPIQIKLLDIKSPEEASSARLSIFDYDEIDKYEKILYLDTDILVQNDLTTLFNLPLEDKLYAVREHTIQKETHGGWFFDFTTIDINTPGMNAGILLFKRSDLIKQLFKDVLAHMSESKQSGARMPFCWEQPFINYHAIRNNLCDISLLKDFIFLKDSEDPISPLNNSKLIMNHFIINKISVKLQQMRSHMNHLLPLYKNKNNLIYFCVFYNQNYFKLLELLLKTLQFYSKTDEFDLLIVTNKDFEPLVQKISADLGIVLKTFCIDFTTIFQAACARLYIFNYEEIHRYEKILYLDTDIIIKKDLITVFSVNLEDKLYGIQSGTIGSPSFGNQFFDFSQIDAGTPGINSGTLLFKNCPVIQGLFSRIQGHVEDHSRKGLHIPYCMDQPFINYHAIKDGLYDNIYMNQHVSLYEDQDVVKNYETSSICHFSFPIGNFAHKYERMKNFVVKILNEELPNQYIHELVGRSYAWGPGYIKFNSDGELETTWGNGRYEVLNASLRHIKVFWHGYYHVLKLDMKSYICIRIGPQDFNFISGNKIKDNSMLYIYGDSHAHLSFLNLAIPHMQLFQYSVTMHRIARDNAIVNFHKSHLNVENVFCLVYGEVDVRCHIGKQVLLGRNELEVCKELVEGYFRTIKSQITYYKAIVIVAISPPADPLDHTHEGAHPAGPLPFIGTNEDRIRYTGLMNGLLEEECKKVGYIYFNPHSHYTRADGCLKYELSDGCIHIGNNEYFLDEFYKNIPKN